MNKLTKGALSMVLVGFVTFSVTNSLLVNQSPNQAAGKNPAGDNNKAEETNEKTLKDLTPTAKVNPEPTKPSTNSTAAQVDLNNSQKNNRVIVAVQSKKSNSTKETSPSPAHVITTTTATHAVTATPAISAPSVQTTTTTSSGSNTTSTNTTTTNNGQKVSQAAKDKAASRRDIREMNGKKK
ncbi:hypothetical protein [Neobacillus sp. LXY-1]|uniref:hypothetical protein n=1 Tax=Neobacillus sp. LXY-1 TaxID=3379133 RepID=UPI003EDEF373